MQTPTLSNEHVTLNPYSEEHIEKTVYWLMQPHIQQAFGLVTGINTKMHEQWLENNPQAIKWAICAQEYLGNLFVFPNLKHRSAYFQIYLGEQVSTGKNIGFRAMEAFLNHAFEAWDFHRIWMHCLPNNVPAIKLYQRLGFTYEGLERESILRNNQYISQGRWSLLKPEWLARNTKA